MSIRLFPLVLMIALFQVSCSNEKPAEEASTTTTTPELANPLLPVADTASTLVTQVPVAGLPTTVTVPATASKGASGKLNPEHGQPGHRCEIAVGAPLDSSPKAGSTPTPTTAKAPAPGSVKVAPTTTVNPPTPVATAPGMNPPHGQPGHRCDISVGEPLNSKPKGN